LIFHFRRSSRSFPSSNTVPFEMVYLTFTPLQGLSEVVLLFMPGGVIPN
jgi:hypothetical protein